MKNRMINVAILEDHQSIIDGYLYRLQGAPGIHVAATAKYGEELGAMLKQHHPIHVLIVDIQVPVSPKRQDVYYPVIKAIPGLLEKYPSMYILAITMHTQMVFVEELIEASVNGIIYKDETESIEKLAKIVEKIANGDFYFSEMASQKIKEIQKYNSKPILSARQREVLNLCAKDPDCTTKNIAEELGIKDSSVRTMLSLVYERLGVRNRTAAIEKARKLGLISGW